MTFSGFLLPLRCTKMLQLIKNGSIWRENFQGQGAGLRFGPCPPLFRRLFHKNFLSSGESITFQESVGWEKLHWEGGLIPRIFPGNKFHEMSFPFYLREWPGAVGQAQSHTFTFVPKNPEKNSLDFFGSTLRLQVFLRQTWKSCWEWLLPCVFFP